VVEFPLFSPASTFFADNTVAYGGADAVFTDGDYGSALKEYGRRLRRYVLPLAV